MFLARVTKRVVSTQKHPAYKDKTVQVVQPILPDGTESGNEWVAIDYVKAGPGDIVVCGGAPGVAQEVFNLKLAPIRTLIVAIVDKIDFKDI